VPFAGARGHIAEPVLALAAEIRPTTSQGDPFDERTADPIGLRRTAFLAMVPAEMLRHINHPTVLIAALSEVQSSNLAQLHSQPEPRSSSFIGSRP
jgi:hypothetical protein